MRISDVLNKVPYAGLSPERNIRISNVLHALLDNLSIVGCTNDVVDMFSARQTVTQVLMEEYPYVWSSLRDIFALPEVTSALIRGIDRTDKALDADYDPDRDDDDEDDGEDDDEVDGEDDVYGEDDDEVDGEVDGEDDVLASILEACSHVRVMAVTGMMFQTILTLVGILAVHYSATGAGGQCTLQQ